MSLDHCWKVLCSAAWLGRSRKEPEVKYMLQQPLDRCGREKVALENAWLLKYLGDSDE